MNHEQKTYEHDYPDRPRPEPGEHKRDHPSKGANLFCEDTDASIGDLAKVLILRQLLSLENSSLAAILKKLGTIDVSNDTIAKVAKSLEGVHSEHTATAQAVVRIEAKLAEIAGKLEATQAETRDMALGLQSSRHDLSASVRAQSQPSTETKN